MEGNTEVTTEGQTTPQTAAPEGAAGGAPSTPGVETEDNRGNLDNSAAFVPNFKFKFAVDGGQSKEQEIEEMYRGLIKDQDSEKKIRDLHEKAFGLDSLKPRYQRSQEHNKQLQDQIAKEYTPVIQELRNVGTHIQRDEILEACAKMGISEEKVFQAVFKRLQYKEMPPEERQRIDRERELQTKAYSGDERVAGLMEQNQQLAFQMRTIELETALNREESRPIAAAVDAALGQGAFRAQVIRQGQLAHMMTKKDISVDQAIKETISIFGKLVQPGQAQPAPAGQPAAQGGKPPVIPHVNGRNAAPVRKEITSIADLKQRAKELQNSAE